MTKRFTDSEKFRDKWYRSLKPKHKCLWEYLVSECSLAGIIDFDYESASFHIGETITKDDIKILSDRIYILPDGKFFIPKFIIFQQGTLNQNNNAHKNIIKELKKYGISETLDNIEFTTPNEGGLMGVLTPISNSKGKSKGKSNSNKPKDIFCNTDFEKCFNIYSEKCKNLIPLGYVRRNRKVLEMLLEFLEETEYNFEYFENLCTKANELKTIVDTKIDFKMMINNHDGIMNGKYIKEYKEPDLSEFNFD